MKRMRKTSLAAGSTAALLLSTAFSAPVRAADPIVLQWQTDNLVENQFEPIGKQIIAEFEAANPGVRIEPMLVARKDNWTRFVTAAQARQAPCVVEENVISAADNGYLLPLDPYFNAEPESFRNAWSTEVLKGSRWQGKLYGIPVWGGVYGEIYNKQMVVEAGLDPAKPPQTWDEYLRWMKALTKPDRWGTAIMAGNTDSTARELLTWIWSNGGEAFNGDLTEATFAKDPKSLEAIKFYIGLIGQGVVAPGPTTTNYLEQSTLFAQGKIASMRAAYYAMGKVEGDNPALAGNMIIGPPPATIPNPPTLFAQAVTSISASCAHPAEAWKFIEFESRPKWAAMRAIKADWLPLRRDLLDNPQIAAQPDIVTFLKIANNARAYPLPTPVWAEIGSIDIVNAVQDAILHPDRIEPIFQALDAKVTRKLKGN